MAREALVGSSAWSALGDMPEYDIYSEELSPFTQDIQEACLCPLAEGRQVADAERQLVGLPRLAVLVMDIGGAPELGAAPPRV
eukprot:1542314-Amphidinium_carterae.1